MARLTRAQMEALSKLFDTFALKDQRMYYEQAIEKYRKASRQVNLLRALFSFAAGFAAALSGLVVQSVYVSGARCTVSPILPENVAYCTLMNVIVVAAALVAVISPALGSAFATLADLYQWERLTSSFTNALESLIVADAYSPHPAMDDITYRASLSAFAQGTLTVMDNEAAQWGQLMRTPEQIEKFLAEARAKAERLNLNLPGGPGSRGQPPPPAG